MAFVQIIEIESDDEQAVREHLSAWDAEQANLAPGYQGSRLLADEDTPGRFLVVVDFASRDDAEKNNDRPETAAWAEKLQGLVKGEPAFTNLSSVYSTSQGG